VLDRVLKVTLAIAGLAAEVDQAKLQFVGDASTLRPFARLSTVEKQPTLFCR
jgi:hypothetical protein